MQQKIEQIKVKQKQKPLMVYKLLQLFSLASIFSSIYGTRFTEICIFVPLSLNLEITLYLYLSGKCKSSFIVVATVRENLHQISHCFEA